MLLRGLRVLSPESNQSVRLQEDLVVAIVAMVYAKTFAQAGGWGEVLEL